MKAIVFEQSGKATSVLTLQEVPQPQPLEGELLIKVLASTINPADLLFIAGKYRMQPNLPQIAGLEGVGVVMQQGKNTLTPTQTLVAFRHKNVWGEYVVVPEKKIIVLPANFPIEKAAQFSLNPITAYGLLSKARLQQGNWLLLTAANSALSKIVIQLAAQKKYSTIAVVRKAEEIAALKALGATEVVLSTNPQLTNTILSITQNKGVNALFDAVGGSLLTQLLPTVAPFGKVLIYGLLDDQPAQLYNATIVFKNLSLMGFGVDAWLQTLSENEQKEMQTYLIENLQQPGFQLPVSEKFPFTQFMEAIQAYESGNQKGKILLEMN